MMAMDGGVGHRDRAVRERVRRDRHERERRHLGREDRAAGRQRVRGGAGGRGDDHAVGAHRVHEAAVDLDGDFDQAAERAAVDHDVVEAEAFSTAGAARALDARRDAACAAPRRSARRASPCTAASMRDSGMSVRKPSRPRLMPISGTAAGASRRAIDSMVPSPPSTMARSTGSRVARRRRRWGSPGSGADWAVSASTHDRVAARAQQARRDARAARRARGCRGRPTSAMRGKRSGTGAAMRGIKPQRSDDGSPGRPRTAEACGANRGIARRTAPGTRSPASATGRDTHPMTMLDARAQHLLKTLVERYIAEGQPVGSRALSRQSGLELSPATIRNVMADLEEMGFIASPHTSAGRIPTLARLPLLRRLADGRASRSATPRCIAWKASWRRTAQRRW